MPQLLDPVQFSIALLAFSVTQAMLQFGDVGHGNAAMRADLPGAARQDLRSSGLAIAYTVGLVLAVAIVLIGVLTGSRADVVGALAVAAIAGALLMNGKMAANEAIHAGAGSRAMRLAFSWQNSPKMGQLAGTLTGSGLGVVVAGLVSAMAVTRVRWVRPQAGWRSLWANCSWWAPGVVVSLCAFLLSWADTYLIASTLGLAEAGMYQAVYRPMLGVTYVVFPALSLLQAAENRGDRGRVRVLGCGVILVASAVLGVLSMLLVRHGSTVWPEYKFPAVLTATVAMTVFMFCGSAIAGALLLVRGATRWLIIANVAALAVMVSGFAGLPVVGINISPISVATVSLLAWTTAAVMQAVGLCSAPERRRFRRWPPRRSLRDSSEQRASRT
ncbi:hypothetical protein [Pseudonocardia kunmingensis]|nr:hypothetical protein [Pseudonocardia kunmingensis]